jgi:hypothetical protein
MANKQDKQVLEIRDELHQVIDNLVKKDGIEDVVILTGIIEFFIQSFAMLGFDEDLLLEMLNKDFKKKVNEIRVILDKNTQE